MAPGYLIGACERSRAVTVTKTSSCIVENVDKPRGLHTLHNHPLQCCLVGFTGGAALLLVADGAALHPPHPLLIFFRGADIVTPPYLYELNE
jgi:hypothetical protein